MEQYAEFWNISATVISGVCVYIICELFAEFVLRPIQEYKQIKAKVSKLLVFYARYYSNPWIYDDNGDCAEWIAAENAIRELAAEVAGYAEIKPCQLFVFYAIPGKNKLLEASSYLIGLSNSCIISRNHVTQFIEGADEFPNIIRRNMRIAYKK